MKRLTVNKIEKFIQTLKSVEKIDGDSEEQKQVAISYLTNYRVRLEERGKRSVKNKGGQAWKLKEPTTARLLSSPTH